MIFWPPAAKNGEAVRASNAQLPGYIGIFTCIYDSNTAMLWKQIVRTAYCTPRQLRFNSGALTATEKKSDMNGRVVSNGHPVVSDGQATNHLMERANGHFSGNANGVAMCRNHAPVTDRVCPMFSTTSTAEPSNNFLTHNAEVCNQGP